MKTGSNVVLDAPVSHPFRNLKRCDRKGFRERAPLEHALRTAGIVPLDRTSVASYMAQKVELFRKPAPTIHTYRQPILGMMMAGVLMMTLTSVVFNLSEALRHAAWLWFSAGAVVLLFGMWGRTCTTVIKNHGRLWAQWHTRSYEGYLISIAPRQVPTEVSTIAHEIEMRCPTVRLLVHYFDEDPFLEVANPRPKNGGEEKFYVAFWDENGFIAPA